jgi:hypothetical protein
MNPIKRKTGDPDLSNEMLFMNIYWCMIRLNELDLVMLYWYGTIEGKNILVFFFFFEKSSE